MRKSAILTIAALFLLCSKLFGAEPCPVTSGETVEIVNWGNTGVFWFKKGERTDCRFFLVSVRGLVFDKIKPELKEEFLKRFDLKTAKLELLYTGSLSQFGQVQLENGSDLGEVILRNGYGFYYFSKNLNAVWQQVYSDAALKAKQESLGGSLLNEDEYGFQPGAGITVQAIPLPVGTKAHAIILNGSSEMLIASDRRDNYAKGAVNYDFWLIGIKVSQPTKDAILSLTSTAKKLETSSPKERYATVTFDGKDLALTLLRQGAAALNGASIVLLPPTRQEVYKTAERQAKLSGIGIWK